MRFLRFLAFVLLLWAAAVCARDVNPYKILDVSPRANDGEIKRGVQEAVAEVPTPTSSRVKARRTWRGRRTDS
jgi:hypothetical protein